MIQMGRFLFFLVRLQAECGGMMNGLLPFRKKRVLWLEGWFSNFEGWLGGWGPVGVEVILPA